MIQITPSGGGCSFVIKAKPGGRRNQIDGEFNGQLKVSVTAPPEDGRANEAIRKLLSDALSVAKSSLSIVRGQTASVKTIRVIGVEVGSLRDRMACLLGGSVPRKRG